MKQSAWGRPIVGILLLAACAALLLYEPAGDLARDYRSFQEFNAHRENVDAGEAIYWRATGFEDWTVFPFDETQAAEISALVRQITDSHFVFFQPEDTDALVLQEYPFPELHPTYYRIGVLCATSNQYPHVYQSILSRLAAYHPVMQSVDLSPPEDSSWVLLSQDGSVKVSDPEEMNRIRACFGNLVLSPAEVPFDEESAVFVTFATEAPDKTEIMTVGIDPSGVFTLPPAFRLREGHIEVPYYQILSGEVDYPMLIQLFEHNH